MEERFLTTSSNFPRQAAQTANATSVFENFDDRLASELLESNFQFFG
jgi:hypothetical protein